MKSLNQLSINRSLPAAHNRFILWGMFALTLLTVFSWHALRPAQAETFDVAGCEAADLIAAINQANNNDEADTITLNGNCQYSLTVADNQLNGGNGLPPVSSTMTILGNGATITRVSTDSFRIFYLAKTGELTLTDMTLQHGALFVQDSSGNNSVSGGGIFNNGGQLVLSRTTIFSNSARFFGGGIYHDSGSLTIHNSRIISNHGGYGGGITLSGGALDMQATAVMSNYATQSGGGIQTSAPLTISQTLFQANVAQASGGGINQSLLHLLLITDTQFINNRASEGGGIYSRSPLSLSRSKLISNVAQSSGGGIYGEQPIILRNSQLLSNTAQFIGGGIVNLKRATIDQSTLAYNSSSSGGAVWNSSGQVGNRVVVSVVDMHNSTVSHNYAQRDGGAFRTNGLLVISASTMINNQANTNTADDDQSPRLIGSGGAIFNSVDSNFTGRVVVKSSIIADNSATNGQGPNIFGPTESAGFNLIDDAAGTSGFGDDDFVGQEPRLGPLQNNGGDTPTHAILTDSLAIDSGACLDGLTVDQRGQPRPNPVSPFCDIGAFESSFSFAPSLTITKQAPAEVRVGQALRYTLHVTNNGEATATNLRITDTIPAGVVYKTGGSAVVGGTLEWPEIAQLKPAESAQLTFIVETQRGFTEVVNSDYGVVANNGIQATGMKQVKTKILVGSSGSFVSNGQRLNPTNSQAAVLGDVDGDKDLDVFVTNNGPNRIWLNDGFGRLIDSGQRLGDAQGQAVDLADVDQDGDADAVVGNDGSNRIWLNDGTGVFTQSQQQLGQGNSQAVVLGDIDNDQDIDVVIGNDGDNRIWLNDGTGVFTQSQQQLGQGNSQTVFLGDIDGNGGVDVVIGNNGPNAIWLNDGTGVFTQSQQQLGGGNSQAIVLGDLNGDQHLDVVIGNDGPNRVWLNDGTGVFTQSQQILGNDNSQTVALGDLDEDNDLDVVIGNGGPNRVWLNDGTGVFTQSQQLLDNNNSQAVVLGDLDGDTDLDAFVANSGDKQANQLLLNQNKIVQTISELASRLNVSQGLTFTIDFPTNAVTQSTVLTYTPIAVVSNPLSSTFQTLGRNFTLEAAQEGAKTDLSFTKPITIRLFYNSAEVQSEQVRLYFYDTERQGWFDVATTCDPVSTYQHGTGFVEIELCHFTEFALVELLKEGNKRFMPLIVK